MDIENGYCYMLTEEHESSGFSQNPMPLDSMRLMLSTSLEIIRARVEVVKESTLFKSEEAQQREILRTERQLRTLEDMAATLLVYETSQLME